jgi:hypothetical protein
MRQKARQAEAHAQQHHGRPIMSSVGSSNDGGILSSRAVAGLAGPSREPGHTHGWPEQQAAPRGLVAASISRRRSMAPSALGQVGGNILAYPATR